MNGNQRYNTPRAYAPYQRAYAQRPQAIAQPDILTNGMQSPLVRLLLMHLAYGGIGGCVLGGLIIWQDFNGIGTMIMRSPDMWLWIGMLFFGLFITFGSAAMGIAVMSMGEERDWPRGEGPDDHR